MGKTRKNEAYWTLGATSGETVSSVWLNHVINNSAQIVTTLKYSIAYNFFSETSKSSIFWIWRLIIYIFDSFVLEISLGRELGADKKSQLVTLWENLLFATLANFGERDTCETGATVCFNINFSYQSRPGWSSAALNYIRLPPIW